MVTVGGRRWPVIDLSTTSFRCSLTAEDQAVYGDSMIAGENITANVTVSNILYHVHLIHLCLYISLYIICLSVCVSELANFAN